jgi:CDP-diacylglycerol--serine O-phosphatidyltransferase
MRCFRLAKFNITESDGYITGLPITKAGCFVTLSFPAEPNLPLQIFMFILLIMDFLMIGTFKLKKV